MTDIDDLIAQYDYAETIETTIADGKVNVRLAEAHPTRNPKWALLTYMAMQKHDLKDHRLIPAADKIDIFCKTLLVSWDVTHGGKPLEPKEAAEFLHSTRGGQLLYQEMATTCAKADEFYQQGSKKKPSSGSTVKKASSARKPRTSRSRRKVAGKKSQPASENTSKDTNSG